MALQYVTYPYLENVESTLLTNALYMELANGKERVVSELQSPKLPRMAESLPDSVAAALRTIKP